MIESADEVILPAATRTQQIAPAQPRRLTVVENSPDLDPKEIAADPLPLPTDLAYVGILAPGRLLSEIRARSPHGRTCLFGSPASDRSRTK